MRFQGGNRSSNAKVSAAGIRLDSRKIYLAFNGIICDDISEFESYMPSHAVRLCGSCVTCEEMRDSLIVPSRRRRMTANVRAERLLKIPAEPSPELRIPGAAAQTRVVSMAGIRLGSWESARARLVSHVPPTLLARTDEVIE